MGDLDRHSFPITCGECGRKTTKTIGWLKTHRQLACRCGSVIQLKADKFLRTLKELEQVRARAEKVLSQKIKIEFKFR